MSGRHTADIFHRHSEGLGEIRVSQNFPGTRKELIPTSRSVVGYYRLEINKELTSGVNIYIAPATSIIQRIFENYKGKIYLSAHLGLRVQYKRLGKIKLGK
jgi:hypothetical protein